MGSWFELNQGKNFACNNHQWDSNIPIVSFNEDEFCNDLYGELQSKGCCSRYVEISHRALEKRVPKLSNESIILEVGGKLGEHCKYVTHQYQKYIVSDYRQIELPYFNEKTVFEQQNVETLSYDDNTFDRVLMGCLLHHVDFPETALRQKRRVTKNGGVVSITLPSDPGMLYRMAKRLGPYRSLRKLDSQYRPEYFHYLQHRNHFPGILSQIYEVFKDDVIREKSFPFPVRAWNINLFTIFQIEIAK
jgi:phosphatidylethanolamine/phosphatidyl-N-methylethanolamine N-methyltransferase